ncbi:MAG: hypothetical protein AAF436_21255, partial [Myxococcota bacterium]
MRVSRAVVFVLVGFALSACSGDGSPDGNTVSESIGESGGTVTSADGRLSMSIPAEALSEATMITVAATSDPGAFYEGLGYSFLPEGLTFNRAVTVTLDHDLELDDPSILRFGRLEDDGSIVDESVLETSANSLTAAIDSFSEHGVVARTDPDDNPPNPVMQADGRTVHVYVRAANAFTEFGANNSFTPPPSSDFAGLHIGRTTELDPNRGPYYVHALSGPARMIWYRYPPLSDDIPVNVSRIAYFGDTSIPVHPNGSGGGAGGAGGGGGGPTGACPISVVVAGATIAPNTDVPLNSTALVSSDTTSCAPAGAATVETRWFEVTPAGGVDELGNPIPAGRQTVNTPDNIRHRYLEPDSSLEIWVGYSIVLEAETWADGALVDTSSVALNTVAPILATQLRPSINGRISTNQPFDMVVERADNGDPISDNDASTYATIEME